MSFMLGTAPEETRGPVKRSYESAFSDESHARRIQKTRRTSLSAVNCLNYFYRIAQPESHVKIEDEEAEQQEINLDEIPPEVLVSNLLPFLNPIDLARLAQVSVGFRDVVKSFIKTNKNLDVEEITNIIGVDKDRVASACEFMLRDNKSLTKINMNNCPAVEMELLEKILKTSPKLEELYLGGVTVTPAIITNLLQMRKLKIVKIGEISRNVFAWSESGVTIKEQHRKIQKHLEILEERLEEFTLETRFLSEVNCLVWPGWQQRMEQVIALINANQNRMEQEHVCRNEEPADDAFGANERFKKLFERFGNKEASGDGNDDISGNDNDPGEGSSTIAARKVLLAKRRKGVNLKFGLVNELIDDILENVLDIGESSSSDTFDEESDWDTFDEESSEAESEVGDGSLDDSDEWYERYKSLVA